MVDVPESLHDDPPPAPMFRQLFDDELRYVCTTLRRLGVRDADLDDIAQEVFIVVHHLLDDYDASRPLRPWLFGIMYRIALRYRALARHRREVFEPAEHHASNTPGPDEQLRDAEQRAFVRTAIESIELHRRAVFILSDIEGRSVPEIAEALAIPLNTAYSRLRRARDDFNLAARALAKAKGET